jgi:predicted nucleic acid-binding protein
MRRLVLLDSNIIIYLRNPNVSDQISAKVGDQTLGICNIVVAEVLGYRGLSQEDVTYFRNFIDALKNYPFDDAVTKKTIELRSSSHIQLPDAIVAATAMVHNLTLWTHNIGDFKDLNGLQLFDPLADVKF